jgi:kanamycin nucleotidyltransferase
MGVDNINTWYPNTFNSQERLAIANEILDDLLNKYKNNLISVAIEGSTAKGMDVPESDLELRAVINRRESNWEAFFYKGMFIGVSFSTLEKMKSKAMNIDYEWPIKSDSLFTCKVLYDPTKLYGKLRKTASEIEEQTDFNLLIKDAITDMYEHVYKVFALKDTESLLAAHESRQVAYWALMSVGLKNKHKFLSSRTMYNESFELESLPEGFKQNIQCILSLNTDVQNLKDNVGKLWVSTLKWAEDFNVNLEKDDLSFL